MFVKKQLEYSTSKIAALQSSENDSMFGKEKHLFIDRVLRLSLKDSSLSIEDAKDETITIILAVCSCKQMNHICILQCSSV